MADRVGGQIVSRETYERLQEFQDLVLKWTKRINLIAPSSVEHLWTRHIEDSAQIFGIPQATDGTWLDVGSGGGFPGIVVAILGRAETPSREFTLIESDQRKATFLRTAARQLDLNVSVIADRIETTAPQNARILSARALTSLSGLLSMIDHHMCPSGLAILHKGQRTAEEIIQARETWRFDLEEHRSLTDPDGRLLAISNLSRVGQ